MVTEGLVFRYCRILKQKVKSFLKPILNFMLYFFLKQSPKVDIARKSVLTETLGQALPKRLKHPLKPSS